MSFPLSAERTIPTSLLLLNNLHPESLQSFWLGLDNCSIFGPILTIGLQTHSGLGALCFFVNNFTQAGYVGGVKWQNTPIDTTVP